MYIWFVYALIVSIVVYIMYDKIKSKDNEDQKHSISIFFFILLLSVTVFYYIGTNHSSLDMEGGGGFAIDDGLAVGFPPF